MLELNNTVINSNILDHGCKSLNNMKNRLTNITRTKKNQELKSENMKFHKNTYFRVGANYSSLALIILPIIAVVIFKKRQNEKKKDH